MPTKILLLSHGGLASGIANSLSLFGIDMSKITAISAYVDGCDPKVDLPAFWKTVKDEDQVLIFTDIHGGSVAQLATPTVWSRPNTYMISGMNFPMLIQACCLDDQASEEDIKNLVELGKSGILYENDIRPIENAEDE
jgi:mannose/fructose-specific phosphotransferase system component IIA